LLTLDVPLVEK